MTDYFVLAKRLQASPLYRRLPIKSYTARMFMRRVHELWFRRID